MLLISLIYYFFLWLFLWTIFFLTAEEYAPARIAQKVAITLATMTTLSICQLGDVMENQRKRPGNARVLDLDGSCYGR